MPLTRGRVGRPAQDLGGTRRAVGRASEDALQARGRPALAGREQRLDIGLRPALVDGGNEDVGVEYAERAHHGLAGHAAHARRPAAEVARDVAEAELAVRLLRLLGEVHVRRDRLHHVAEATAGGAYVLFGDHGLPFRTVQGSLRAVRRRVTGPSRLTASRLTACLLTARRSRERTGRRPRRRPAPAPR